ncbi:MAG TPA: alpha/beta fold hydrolase, partial [Pirellulales bacterium]|jgi:pimeloyl-ACP methyl ester carboxylesterase|nr:alpha/beta fold hydrolase [Pirellulales bacterium]
VLLLHGNGSSRTAMQNVMRMLVAEELTVMSISLRAHGDSTGEINDFGFGARHEVVAAVRFLEAEFPGRPIYIVGRSLGAAAALFAADELGDRVAGYLLEQPYTDLAGATWNRLQSRLPPVLDWVAYRGMRCCAVALFPVDLAIVAPADHLLSIPKEVPITIATGSADRHARLEEVRDMHRRVADHTRLIVFEGAEHVDLDRYDPGLYRQTLLESVGLAETPGSSSSSADESAAN